jgi:hypothetical protein
MPYTIELIRDGTGMLCIGSGVATAQEVMDARRAFATWGPAMRSMTHAIIDLSAVTTIEATEGDIRGLVDYDRQLCEMVPDLKVAVIAPSDLAFGLARMYQAHAAALSWEILVFRAAVVADAWLARVAPAPETRAHLGNGA